MYLTIDLNEGRKVENEACVNLFILPLNINKTTTKQNINLFKKADENIEHNMLQLNSF